MLSKVLRQTGLTVLTAYLALGVVWSQSVSLPKATLWPQNRSAAVSLTFDDAMQSQLDNAAPVLNKHHLKGTFFVTTGPASAWRTHPDEWKRLAEEGNEIGSHSVNHPSFLPGTRFNSQDYTPEMMRHEIQQSAKDITALVGGGRGMTFAYPNGDTTFGPPAAQLRNEVLYYQYVAESYFAARGANVAGAASPENLDLLAVPNLGLTCNLVPLVGAPAAYYSTIAACPPKDFAQILEMMDPPVRDHKWAVYMFHGVGGQYLFVSTQTLDELAGYLEQHSEIWTAPFGDVIRYIQESKALLVQTKEGDSAHVQFALAWPLEARIFDLPLTLQWELPVGWAIASKGR